MGKIVSGHQAWSSVRLPTRAGGGGGSCSTEFVAYLACLDKEEGKSLMALMPADMADAAPANLKPTLEREVQLYPGVTLLWNGDLPVMRKVFGSTEPFELVMSVGQNSLMLEATIPRGLTLDMSGFKQLNLNFIRLSGVTFVTAIATASAAYSLSSTYEMATMGSDCSSPGDPFCIVAEPVIGVGLTPTAIALDMGLATNGVWMEPLGMNNIAIVDPAIGLGLSMDLAPCMVGACVPIPGLLFFERSEEHTSELQSP